MFIIGYIRGNKDTLENSEELRLSISPLRATLKDANSGDSLIEVVCDVKYITDIEIYPMDLNGIEPLSDYDEDEAEADENKKYIKFPISAPSIDDLYDRGGYIAYYSVKKSNCEMNMSMCFENMQEFITNFYTKDKFILSDDGANNEMYIDAFEMYIDTFIDEPPVSFISTDNVKRKMTTHLNGDSFRSKYVSHDMFNADAIFDCSGSEYAIMCSDSAILIKGNCNTIIVECDNTDIMITGDDNMIVCLADDVRIADLGHNNKWIGNVSPDIRNNV